jgi:hypothetical protein
MTIPLYAYDLTYRNLISLRQVLKLEREGRAKLVHHKKGRVARCVLRKRPGDPEPSSARDYMGKGYSFKHRLDDGHRPWALKPLTGRINRGDQLRAMHSASAARLCFLGPTGRKSGACCAMAKLH